MCQIKLWELRYCLKGEGANFYQQQTHEMQAQINEALAILEELSGDLYLKFYQIIRNIIGGSTKTPKMRLFVTEIMDSSEGGASLKVNGQKFCVDITGDIAHIKMINDIQNFYVKTRENWVQLVPSQEGFEIILSLGQVLRHKNMFIFPISWKNRDEESLLSTN